MIDRLVLSRRELLGAACGLGVLPVGGSFPSLGIRANCAPSPALDPQRIKSIIDEEVSAWRHRVDNNSLRGVAVALYHPRQPPVQRFYHHGEARPQEAVTENTIFCIGSVTKVFTATLLALLRGPEPENLKVPVGRYLPSLRSQQITLFDLARR